MYSLVAYKLSDMEIEQVLVAAYLHGLLLLLHFEKIVFWKLAINNTYVLYFLYLSECICKRMSRHKKLKGLFCQEEVWAWLSGKQKIIYY